MNRDIVERIFQSWRSGQSDSAGESCWTDGTSIYWKKTCLVTKQHQFILFNRTVYRKYSTRSLQSDLLYLLEKYGMSYEELRKVRISAGEDKLVEKFLRH